MQTGLAFTFPERCVMLPYKIKKKKLCDSVTIKPGDPVFDFLSVLYISLRIKMDRTHITGLPQVLQPLWLLSSGLL